MVFINIDSKEKSSSQQLAFLLAVLGVLLTIVIYLAPTSQDPSLTQISIEEVELVHAMLDGIKSESPELSRLVDNFRISFSENSRLLNSDFFKADQETQHRLLLESIVAKSARPRDAEIAVTGE